MNPTCMSCGNEIVASPHGWSDGTRVSETLCLASLSLTHAPRVMAVAGCIS